MSNPSSTLPPSPRGYGSKVTWIGGVIHLAGYLHNRKPLRVAAWIDSSGSLLSAAVVEGHGGMVLRELLKIARAQTPDDRQPHQLTIRPSDATCFHDETQASVVAEHNRFLNIVLSDREAAAWIPYSLPIYRGVGPTKSRAQAKAPQESGSCSENA